MMRKRTGFTLTEILVVMAIIAILAAMLLPAVRKARAKAIIDRANAELQALAGVETMVKQDIGFYVRLCDLPDASLTLDAYVSPTAPPPPDDCHWGPNWGGTSSDGTFAYYDPANDEDSTGIESELTRRTDDRNPHPWDGPYHVFQDKNVLKPGQGIQPAADSGVTGWGPNPGDPPVAPFGTPLDPWGRPYLLAYNDTESVMVIYSAGPNGRIQTNAGSTTPAGDDLLYRFR